MKPTGKHRRAFELGREARKKGKSLADNPYMLSKFIAHSAWWEKGWLEVSTTNGERDE